MPIESPKSQSTNGTRTEARYRTETVTGSPRTPARVTARSTALSSSDGAAARAADRIAAASS